MDPLACLLRWQSACLSKEWTEAKEAARDLCRWLAAGGFEPDWPNGARAAFRRYCDTRRIHCPLSSVGFGHRKGAPSVCTTCDGTGRTFANDGSMANRACVGCAGKGVL